MAHDDEPPVRYEVSGRVARITLNRAAHSNALSAEMIAGLLDAFSCFAADNEVRVAVLTGAGERSFCAGGDLGDLARMGAPDASGSARPGASGSARPGASGAARPAASGAARPAAENNAVRLFSAFRELGKPIIARVAGHALGGGLGLAVSCDLAIAADDVKLGTPEINVGLWPMMIMAVLNKNIAPKQALKLYYTGELISAARAAEIGLLTEVVPRDDLDRRVDELASVIAGKSPVALRLGRAAFFEVGGWPLRDQLAYLHEQLTVLAATHDAREGIAAFLDKRAARFTGN